VLLDLIVAGLAAVAVAEQLFATALANDYYKQPCVKRAED
jgi:hypothetical protein